MKIKDTIFFIILFLSINCLGQVTVSIANMTNANTGALISTGGPIVIAHNGSIRVSFTVQMSKSSSQVIDGTLYIYSKQSSSSTPQSQSAALYVVNSAWTGSSTVHYSSSQDITLYASSFNASGGVLYAEFESNSGIKYKSSDWTIAVNSPSITNNSINGNQTVIKGNAAMPITGSTPSGGNGTYTYSWQRQTIGAWSTISGATGKDYSPGNLTVTTNYKRIVTSGTAPSSTSNIVTITVIDTPISNNSISGSQTIEGGTAPTSLIGTVPSGGSGNYSYQWQRYFSAWHNIEGATSKDYSPGPLTGTTRFRRVVNSGTAPSSISNEVVITIINYPHITNNSIAFDGTSVVIGSSPEGGNGEYQYDYYLYVVLGDGLEYNSGYTSNKDFVIPNMFLSLSESYMVGIQRIVKSGNKTSTSQWIIIEKGITDITNNTISFDDTSLFITGSLPSGASNNYTYNWQWLDWDHINWESQVANNSIANSFNGQTGKDFSVPYALTTLDMVMFVRRVVMSGTKISYSEWVCIYVPSNGLSSERIMNDMLFEELHEESLAYPNPTSAKINFNITTSGATQIVVFHPKQAEPIEVFNGNVENNKIIEWIIPESFPKGVYYYKIVSQNSEAKTGRFIYQ